MTAEAQSSRRRFSFIRFLRPTFSLRVLLVLLTLFSIWLAVRVRGAKQQHAAVDAVISLGGIVYYDYQRTFSPDGHPTVNPAAPMPFPAWPRPMWENLFPPRIISINLRDTKANDEHVRAVAALQAIEYLDLSNTQITDRACESAAKLTHLRDLCLINTNVTDRGVSHLSGLRLEKLSLWKTKVTDQGVHYLRDMRTLRSLVLDETEITDAALEDVGRLTELTEWLGLVRTKITDRGLPHLTGLKKLREVNLIGTSVTSEGLRSLRKALPQTTTSPFN